MDEYSNDKLKNFTRRQKMMVDKRKRLEKDKTIKDCSEYKRVRLNPRNISIHEEDYD